MYVGIVCMYCSRCIVGIIVLMSETIDGLRDKFMKWKRTFESKGLKVNHGKTNVMVSSGISLDGLS